MAGFGLEVDFGLTHNITDIQKAIDSDTTFSIRPNSLKSTETDTLMNALSSLAMGGVAETGELKNQETVYQNLMRSARDVLAKEGGDPITAVVVPMASLIAVNDHFKHFDDPTQDTAAFYEFLNRMYIAERSLRKEFQIVKEQWTIMLARYKGLAQTHPLPQQLLDQWDRRLTLVRSQLLALNTEEEIVKAAGEYTAMLPTKPWNPDVLTTDSYLALRAEGMKDQFKADVLKPYNAMLDGAPTPPPTPKPTPAPSYCLFNSLFYKLLLGSL